jgi:hypothetical protein
MSLGVAQTAGNARKTSPWALAQQLEALATSVSLILFCKIFFILKYIKIIYIYNF